jgi:hypothetical protein
VRRPHPLPQCFTTLQRPLALDTSLSDQSRRKLVEGLDAADRTDDLAVVAHACEELWINKS